MNMNKKTRYILQITLLVILLAACKNKTSNDTQTQETTTAQAPKEFIKEAPEVFNMITIKGDWFIMGNKDEPLRNPTQRKHKTYVSDFMLSSSEVTQDHYEEIMQENPSIAASKYRPVQISRFTDALAFCNKLSINENLTPCYAVYGETDPDLWTLFWGKDNEDFYLFMKNLTCDFNADGYRLPTEAEWMYAARSGIHHDHFTYSGSDTLLDVAVYSGYDATDTLIKYTGPEEVKTKLPNSLGLYDMTGNLQELVWDYFAAFPEYDTVQYRGPDRRDSTHAEYGILKGSDFGYHNDEDYDLEERFYFDLDSERESFGFRLCRSIISEETRKEIEKAQQLAKNDQLERIKESVYSKLVKVDSFTYQNRDKTLCFPGLYITKQPLSINDVFLLSDIYTGSYRNKYIDKSDIIIYNAIRYLNTISSLLGYEPYYTILYPDEEGTYSAVDDDYLIAHNLDFRISYENYDKDLNKLFNKIKIIGNPLADGFRYVTQTEETDEEDDLQYLSDITYSLGDLKSKAIVSCGLPPEIDPTELKENENHMVTTDITNDYDYEHFYICKNIPQAPEQLAELENLIAQYAEKVRVKKRAAFESVLGKSLNTLMKPVKGGKALQSLDIENKNFVDVTIGSFEMSEIPFTEKFYYALMEQPYPDNDSSPHPDSYRELSWYQAAAICNMLSDLYQYQRVYTFYRETVAIDYTANGFRMPTEAEWEHAARSGTTDKSIKYGVTIDSVIYYGNPSLYSYVEDDWENYYRWRGDDPVNAYTGKANSLGIYNLAGYCTEWCNDYQYFDYYDFEGDTPTYSVSCYDTYPYQSTKMPYGQIYAPERIVKGAYRYTSEASDVKLSKRETRKIYNTDHALRLVRTTNPQEMKKLLQEHESEHLENLKSQKPFFDQNLNMVAVKAQDYIYRNSYGEKRENKIIHVEDFEIADAEITNEMFIRLMHYNPWAQDTDEKDYNDAPNAPVTNFDPLAAYYFCNELSKVYGYTPFYNIDEQTINADADGFRLPTTEEWIFAAMEANPDYNLLYSGGSDRDAVGVFERSKPQEIKTMQPNKLGLYDMSGNAEELVHDNAGWRDYYNWYSAMGSSYDYDHESLYYEGSWHRDDTETVGLRVVRTPHTTQ